MDWRLGVLLCVVCQARGSEAGDEQVSRTVNELGYRLLVATLEQAGDHNVLLGPTSIAGVLGMALLGSVGDTHDELAAALGFSRDILTNRRNHEELGSLLQSLDDGGANTTRARTLYADAVFVSERAQLRDLYREFLQRVYRGAAVPADFDKPLDAQTIINQWVKEKTLGKVEQFLRAPLPRDTRVALLSAHHFSGQWARPFTPEFTMNMTFNTSVGKEVQAAMMLNFGHFNYLFSEEHACHLVSLPYNDSASSMFLLKPRFPRRLTLPALLSHLDWTTIDALTQRMRNESTVIRLPKMSLRSSLDLKAGLKAVGIKSIFDDEKANFALMISGSAGTASNSTEVEELITRLGEGEARGAGDRQQLDQLPNPGVHVDAVMHDVLINIDEWGTEATAASGGFLSRSANSFLADSPFLCFIRDETSGLVTFSAVIQDPTLP